MEEEWLPVVGWERWYEVSNVGRVRRAIKGKGTRVGRVLASTPTSSDGYCKVNLHDSPGARICRTSIHILVAQAFIGPIPEGCEVNHIDTVRHNNTLSNLEYLTPLENVRHSRKLGRYPVGESVKTSKLKVSDVLGIRSMSKDGVQHKDIARTYGIHRKTVSVIVRRKSWRHIPVDATEYDGEGE